MRDLLDKLSILENLEEPNTPEIGDEFGISFSPDFEISTHVVEVLEDGIVVELDDTALEMLTNEGVRFFEGELVEGVAGPKSCWKGYRKTGTQPGTGKNAGKRVNDCEKIKEQGVAEGRVSLKQIYGDKKKLDQDQVMYGRMTQAEFDKKWKRTERPKPTDIEQNKKQGVAEGSGDKKPYPNTWHDVDPKIGKLVDKMSPEEKVKKGYANPSILKKNKKQGVAEGDIDEAEYQGRNVPLGKKMAGDVKKSKVYVKNPQGNVVKVNFGDKKMRIKKSNPARRKSFRARHNCANPGPRHKARYWSCRSW